MSLTPAGLVSASPILSVPSRKSATSALAILLINDRSIGHEAGLYWLHSGYEADNRGVMEPNDFNSEKKSATPLEMCDGVQCQCSMLRRVT